MDKQGLFQNNRKKRPLTRNVDICGHMYKKTNFVLVDHESIKVEKHWYTVSCTSHIDQIEMLGPWAQ